MQNIIIEDRYIQEILSIAGFPLLNLTDGDFELTEDQIKTLVIIPCLREFYRFFPIPVYESHTVSSTFSIDFPSLETFNVIDARLNTVGNLPASRSTNPFINNRYYSTGGSSIGAYGTRNTYGLENAVVLERATRQSHIEMNKAFRVRPNLGTRKLEGYSNTYGKLNITWATWSEVFADIPYSRMNEVISLCQSKLLELLYMLRGQQSGSGLPDEFNYSLFQDMSEKLKDNVMVSWRGHTKVVMIG